MKKQLLAVAIPALLASNLVGAYEIVKTDEASVDFYGQLRTRFDKQEDKDIKFDAGSSRAGVTVNYDYNDSIQVFGKVEFSVGFSDGDSSSFDNRLHYVGVNTDFGKFTFGRQWIVSDDVWGADYSYFNGGTGIRHATLSGARHDSLIKYNYEGESFWLAADYGLQEDDKNQELVEVYAGTSFGPVNLHAGFGKNRDKAFTITNEAEEETTADIENTYYEGTVEYAFDAALIGFTYYNAELSTQTGLSIDENAYSVSATYSFDNNVTAYTGFEYVAQDSDSLGIDGDGTMAYIGAVYKPASWARIFAEYGLADGTTLGYINDAKVAKVDATEVDAESRYTVGFRVYW